MADHSQAGISRAEHDHPVDSETLWALPPSAKLVLWVMEQEGTMTQWTLAEETRLPRRTVRDALDRLRELDVVDARPYFRDARQSLYTLTAAGPRR